MLRRPTVNLDGCRVFGNLLRQNSFWLQRLDPNRRTPLPVRVVPLLQSPEVSLSCFGRFLVLQTTFDVFASVGPDNSFERLTERSVGFVTDQSSDFWELFVTPFK